MPIGPRLVSGSTANSPVRRTLLASNFRFQALENIVTPFTDETVEHSYESLQQAADDIAATSNLDVVIETVTTLPSGRQIRAMRINDDGKRPIVLVSLGIHGNELNLAKGVMTAAKEFATSSSNNVIALERQHLAVVVILGVNPDGM